ncbi:Alkaline phosphatase synthesis transcriptional regulatory protein PhoP [bacterium HR17]|uniref:Alkaline phosphatase synthesis transcriptional regulatory protein PhoP n=1 Tax=Candidatus Fervidibacter japonicus TaxID=2035412 RepID=A0A2H5XAC8_9BACT|nr:Alkaline phosphatase synthesis transcriptional regulatory protein PhoP [bacterium HR17]
MQQPAAGQKKRVLVVDDERHIVRLVQVNLERQGYEVLTAYDGVECLEKAKAEKPDLIVLDVMMPRMDGFEALQRLKSDPETNHIPVIMLTARAQDRDVLQGYTYGADLYLTKPFSPLELISLVKRVFESQEEEEGIIKL